MSAASEVRSYVFQKLDRIFRMNEGLQRAELAKLRRGVGKKPGELAELWGTIFEGAPESLIGCGKEPSYAEWAVYEALTLFALHSQGNAAGANDVNVSFGTAAAKLAGEADNERILKRMNSMATSESIEELSYHLRGIIQLLRAESIGLNYADLAADLFLYQMEESRNRVRLKWGRDYYFELNKNNYKTEKEGNENE